MVLVSRERVEAPGQEPAQVRSVAFREYPVSADPPDRGRAGPAGHAGPEVRSPCLHAPLRFGNNSRTAPATSERTPTTGGNATPSRFSVAISSGPASTTVSRSVQNTPPQTSATIPITTSTRPTICLSDTLPSRPAREQARTCSPARKTHAAVRRVTRTSH